MCPFKLCRAIRNYHIRWFFGFLANLKASKYYYHFLWLIKPSLRRFLMVELKRVSCVNKILNIFFRLEEGNLAQEFFHFYQKTFYKQNEMALNVSFSIWRKTHVSSTFNGIRMIEFWRADFTISWFHDFTFPRLELGVFKLKINFKCSFFPLAFLYAGEKEVSTSWSQERYHE